MVSTLGAIDHKKATATPRPTSSPTFSRKKKPPLFRIFITTRFFLIPPLFKTYYTAPPTPSRQTIHQPLPTY